MTFSDLPLLPKIQQALEAHGFTKPTEIQEKVIPILLKNPHTDIHAQAQTGTGKTLAFGIPLLQSIDPSIKSVQALIVAPTRELVLQIYESIKEISRQTNILLEPVYGGMPIDRQITNIKRGAQIIIGTPGRLNDHLRRRTLSLQALKVLVLDEADIMLDMGFKDEINSILDSSPKDRAIWLFSATVLPGIKQLIKTHMKDVLTVRASEKTILSPQVKQYYCIIPMRQRVEAIARFIEAAPNFYGIIFCRTKDLTREVMEQLASRGFKVNSLHGDMKQTLRNQVIKGFKNKDFNILVATDVAARGIDVANLTHVINFSMPDEHESYIHRIGRTGRSGKEGIALLFISSSELYRVKRLEKEVNTMLQEIAVPPLEAIINVKIGAVSDFIEQAKKSDERLSPVHKVLKELITSFTQEEIQNSLINALEDKFFKDIIHEDLGKISSDNRSKEICIELGQDHGFSEETMRSYLYSTCKLQPQEVFKVRVLKNKTFISIPENRLSDCKAAMAKQPITEKHHKIYLVENYYNKDTSSRQENRAPQRKNRSTFNKKRTSHRY